MSVKASEISDLIKSRIENFKSASEARNVGTVVTVTDGICRIHGLADVRYGEMIEFPGNLFGLAMSKFFFLPVRLTVQHIAHLAVLLHRIVAEHADASRHLVSAARTSAESRSSCRRRQAR